ncbi:baseplate J/gp47 family protein [Sungkyunkwania multivorans]|uniref:Baseplate J/gp47 family protein n=1 Tax=Sungkyunkwania multivorans TaxID=1173618 RepID=A0ABW3CV66_9FLAO
MSTLKNIENTLYRNGSDQVQRFVEALDPANFELMDFEVEDWVLFAFHFAKQVNYFDVSDDTNASNNWQEFFNITKEELTEIPFRTSKEYIALKQRVASKIEELELVASITPHLTLFLCFLNLLNESKERFNDLTKRHLDFYYKEILQVSKTPAKEDTVHILFELAKKSTEELIKAKTKLNAGEDTDGNPRIYETDEDLVVNKASVGALRTIYNDHTTKTFYNSFDPKTSDGIAEPLPETSPYWWPFGYINSPKEFTELPKAKVGFTIASPMLQLSEGLRSIQIVITFEDITTAADLAKLVNPAQVMKVEGSGAEDWIRTLALKETISVGGSTYVSQLEASALKLALQLPKDEEALVAYNAELLLEKYNTSFPLLRFVIDQHKEAGHDLYRHLAKQTVKSIQIDVNVSEAAEVLIENDNSTLKSQKPFFPFTAQPIEGSNFYVNYPEAFSKAWNSFTINFDWKDRPDSFSDWYKAYKKEFLNEIPKSLIVDASTTPPTKMTLTDIVDNDQYFKIKATIRDKEEWKHETETNLFSNVAADASKFSLNIQKPSVNPPISFGDVTGVKLTLQQSFLHSLFPRLYAVSISNDSYEVIPNEPYTPLAENITISYSASENTTFQQQNLPLDEDVVLQAGNTEEAYKNERVRLFHEHPFGQAEEHNYLKVSRFQKGIIDKFEVAPINATLVPEYCHGGNLLIGLKDAKPLQNVALLFQALEGSENPLTKSFELNEKIEWAILCDDKWKDVSNDLLNNSIDNFLRSGIVKFAIPREATNTNTLLPEGYIWVRAKMHRGYDAVSKLIDIHAQVVESTFINNGNTLDHLENGLPAKTIKKLITRIPQIKSLEQPYVSFDGAAEESDADYYRRISERLRHKNRAVNQWDYEHLILQQFPDIYKVKCLNHSKGNNFLSPGNVTIIVVPDTVDKNVFDIHQPRVSKATKNAVTNYVNSLNTKLVTAEVIDPNYEEVQIELEVSFYEGFDDSFYTKELKEDIKRFLSPWAYDDTKKVNFGRTLHKSVLIDYLEKLHYVDYIQEVVMNKIIKKDEEEIVQKNLNSITPSNPKSILVSSKEHNVSTVTSNCKGEKPIETNPCQV